MSIIVDPLHQLQPGLSLFSNKDIVVDQADDTLSKATAWKTYTAIKGGGEVIGKIEVDQGRRRHTRIFGKALAGLGKEGDAVDVDTRIAVAVNVGSRR